jgi:hypothetical protein
MRIFLALFLLGISMAANVTPKYLGIKDTGNQNLPTMAVGIQINCDNKELKINVATNGTGAPVSGATEYLFYTDYGYQPLPNSVKTGTDGTALMKVPGTINFLTGLFILRTDHPEHRSREIEFTYEKCFKDPAVPIGEVYGENEGSGEPPPELKKLDLEVKPVCSGTAVTGQTAIVKSGGVPLSGAYVSVEDLSPAKKVAGGNSDGTGQFQFPGCGDEYSVRASKGGYESREINVTLIGCDKCPLPPPKPPETGNGSPASGSQQSNATNKTEQAPKPDAGDGKPAAPSACPLGLAILSILALRARL